jgi:hypothetical protein
VESGVGRNGRGKVKLKIAVNEVRKGVQKKKQTG